MTLSREAEEGAITVRALCDGKEVAGRLEWRPLGDGVNAQMCAYAVIENWALGLDFQGPGGPFVWPGHGIEVTELDRPKCCAFLDAGPPKDSGLSPAFSAKVAHAREALDRVREGRVERTVLKTEGGRSYSDIEGTFADKRGTFADTADTFVAPSPADGPAKVFGREWVSRGSWLEMEFAGFSFDAERADTEPDEPLGGWVYRESENDLEQSPEEFLLARLSALLSLIPAEQVVQAMGEETRLMLAASSELEVRGLLERAQRELADHQRSLSGREDELETRALEAEDQLAEALARAEKAEANASMWETTSLCDTARREEAEAKVTALLQGDLGSARRELLEAALTRAEQAERERDEARREIERLQVAARAILREAVTTESRKVTYNG